VTRPEKKQHRIEIDVTPIVEAAEQAQTSVRKGFDALRDFTLAAMPEKKWVSEENPYRKALLGITEALRDAETTAENLGREAVKDSPHSFHQKGRSHGFREALMMVTGHMPPEPAVGVKKKEK
jgi:hypothetical protein